MRILVTGVDGLVGVRIAAILSGRGHQILGVDRGPRRAQGDFGYLGVDLSREPDVQGAFAEFRPEAVVHPASMTDVDQCEKDPIGAWACNVTGTANVARASAAAGAHLVHVSTDYVFDGEAGPYELDAVPNPKGVYAVTKHAAEQAVKVLAKGAAIARTAVVYGYPPSARSNFGVWVVSKLERGEQVPLFSDQYVSPTLADSLAQMLAELAERRLGGVWHTCGAEVVNRVEFAQAACSVFGFDPKLISPRLLADAPLSAPRPKRSGLKVDKTMRELKAKPLGLRESLERFRAAYRGAKGKTT